MADDNDGFLSRWSRRKQQARQAPAEPALPAPLTAPPAVVQEASAAVELPAPAPTEVDERPAPPPAPTLEEARALTPDSDFRRFVTRGVAPEVRHAALKQLFSDPHFNTMDGLDTYIDDYGIPDPLPAGMLRQMNQSKLLGLFAAEDAADAERERLQAQAAAATLPAPDPQSPAPDDARSEAPCPAPLTEPACATAHEDPDLQLQPVDEPGHPDAAAGPGQDAGGQRRGAGDHPHPAVPT